VAAIPHMNPLGGGLGAYSRIKFLKFQAQKCNFLHSEHLNVRGWFCGGGGQRGSRGGYLACMLKKGLDCAFKTNEYV
jgi:hypothetical protein